MHLRALLIASLVLAAGVAAVRPAARTLRVVDLLEAYAAGRFGEAVAALEETTDLAAVLVQFRQEAPAWIEQEGPDAQDRRELAAATLALEAARAGQWREWKQIRRQPQMCAGSECYQPPSVLTWKAPPLLIEWACERLRARESPHPIERWWQLAALAVAQRSEDSQFLIGDTNLGAGLGTEEVGNVQDEIKHLDHVTPRFPKEMRFVLAQGIARDRVWPEDAVQVYGALANDPDVGGEAVMRLGAMHLRRRNHAPALKSLERAEALTRDPYVVFLIRYFSGQLHEQQGRLDRAEAAYRGAVAAVPHAQSATVALAALAFRGGRRAEAHELTRAMLAADPRAVDPWRAYVHADDRFWPQLVGRLRSEILR
jgi:tetratricopeptide (TPR) repeat protein